MLVSSLAQVGTPGYKRKSHFWYG